MTLNRNPDNFFAETEQVAFHPGHLVPGLDFTNDPLLQGRLFSYTDTQLIRLGGPNFHEIPINRSVAPVHNNQRDGHMRQEINKGKTSYSPNTIAKGCPFQAGQDMSGFTSYAERVDGQKIRTRSKSFIDHYSQAKLFWNSMTDTEKTHIVKALRFELGKVKMEEIRKRMLIQLAQVDQKLASLVAKGLGLEVPSAKGVQLNLGVPADADPAEYQSEPAKPDVGSSKALSMDKPQGKGIKTRQIAILAADGVSGDQLAAMKKALMAEGAMVKLVAPHLGTLKPDAGDAMKIDGTLQTEASVLYDAVYVPGGQSSVDALKQEPDAVRFVREAFMHCKPIAASGEGIDFLKATENMGAAGLMNSEGIVMGQDSAQVAKDFIAAIAQHRFWSREKSLV